MVVSLERMTVKEMLTKSEEWKPQHSYETISL